MCLGHWTLPWDFHIPHKSQAYILCWVQRGLSYLHSSYWSEQTTCSKATRKAYACIETLFDHNWNKFHHSAVFSIHKMERIFSPLFQLQLLGDLLNCLTKKVHISLHVLILLWSNSWVEESTIILITSSMFLCM